MLFLLQLRVESAERQITNISNMIKRSSQEIIFTKIMIFLFILVCGCHSE